MTVSWFRVNQQPSAETAVSDGPPEQVFAAHNVKRPDAGARFAPASVYADGGAGPRFATALVGPFKGIRRPEPRAYLISVPPWPASSSTPTPCSPASIAQKHAAGQSTLGTRAQPSALATNVHRVGDTGLDPFRRTGSMS
jgi:hypothetical protein